MRDGGRAYELMERDCFRARLCIVLFLTIPRAPNFKFPSADIIGVDNSTVSFSRTPTNFSFAGSVNMIGMHHCAQRQKQV